MRLWSDVLDREGMLYNGLRDAGLWTSVGLEIDQVVEPARKRRVRYDIALTGHDERHTRFKNFGTSKYRPYPLQDKAATWMDWGWFLAVLFRHDPCMVAGHYDGQADFLTQTASMWAHRLSTKDRSCVEWANSRYGLDDFGPGYTPFADLSHLPPNKLVRLDEPEQVDAWLAS